MKMRFRVLLAGCLLLTWPAVARADTVTIRLRSVTTLTTQHDIAPKGKANKGDSIEFKDLLLNAVPQFGKKKGKPVGFDAGIVRYTSASAQNMLVKVTFPGTGTLTYRGALKLSGNGNAVMPIVSGTGGFTGAHGTVTIGPGEGTAANTFKVTVPGKLTIGGGGLVA